MHSADRLIIRSDEKLIYFVAQNINTKEFSAFCVDNNIKKEDVKKFRSLLSEAVDQIDANEPPFDFI